MDRSKTVSVIVPVRNEEATIEDALRSLAAQAGVAEILVVDDQSQDRTGEILARLQGELAGLRILRVESLPVGWQGKNHALATAARQARGEWLLFTDADVEHRPGSLAALVGCAEEAGADLLSISPGQATPTWWEKAVIPLVYVQLAKLFRFEEVSDPESPVAAANGQYLLIRRAVYEQAGGHAAIRGELLEDVELARRVKTGGGRLLFLPGADWARTRMYRSFSALWGGWTKNLYLLYGRRWTRILGTVVELGILDLVPVLAAVVLGVMFGRQPGDARFASATAVAVILIAWRHGCYAASLEKLGFNRSLVVYRTLGAMLLGGLLLNSLWVYCGRGTVEWKGRYYPAGR